MVSHSMCTGNYTRMHGNHFSKQGSKNGIEFAVKILLGQYTKTGGCGSCATIYCVSYISGHLSYVLMCVSVFREI